MPRTILPWSDTLSTAPVKEPVSLADAKRNSDVDDDHRDVDFERWISAARKKVEHDARLYLINQTRVRTLDCVPSDRVITLYRPLSSVTSVQYKDTNDATQTYDAANYTVDTARGAIIRDATASWPLVGDSPNVMTVTYVAGHGTEPEDVPEAAIGAMHLLIAHWYEHRLPSSSDEMKALPYAYDALIHELRGGEYP